MNPQVADDAWEVRLEHACLVAADGFLVHRQAVAAERQAGARSLDDKQLVRARATVADMEHEVAGQDTLRHQDREVALRHRHDRGAAAGLPLRATARRDRDDPGAREKCQPVPPRAA